MGAGQSGSEGRLRGLHAPSSEARRQVDKFPYCRVTQGLLFLFRSLNPETRPRSRSFGETTQAARNDCLGVARIDDRRRGKAGRLQRPRYWTDDEVRRTFWPRWIDDLIAFHSRFSAHAVSPSAPGVMRPRISCSARRSSACCRRDWPSRSSPWPSRSRSSARRGPSAPSGRRRHVRRRRALSTPAHWRFLCGRASACPAAFCDGCARRSRAEKASFRSSPSGRPCPPTRRSLYWFDPAPLRAGRRHAPRRRSPPICE
jgi:hypothetical protein